ncbi:MAG TPA: hypothetical protein VKB96_10940 [Gammaproteobacteria bacterium]|nr:hypothetical protein [Gammaproteobacteria bacterium]
MRIALIRTSDRTVCQICELGSEVFPVGVDVEYLTEADWVDEPQDGAIWNGERPAQFSMPVPSKVSKMQIRNALWDLGVMPGVKAYLAQADGRTNDAWDCADYISYDDPLINIAAQALNIDKDALFLLAAAS